MTSTSAASMGIRRSLLPLPRTWITAPSVVRRRSPMLLLMSSSDRRPVERLTRLQWRGTGTRERPDALQLEVEARQHLCRGVLEQIGEHRNRFVDVRLDRGGRRQHQIGQSAPGQNRDTGGRRPAGRDARRAGCGGRGGQRRSSLSKSSDRAAPNSRIRRRNDLFSRSSWISVPAAMCLSHGRTITRPGATWRSNC